MVQGIRSCLSKTSASTSTLRTRGAVQEEAPPNSVVRPTRRTVRSTYGVLVRVWGDVVVSVCGCTLRSHGMARAVRRVRLQDLNTPPPKDLGGNGIVAVYGRVLSDVRL